MIENVISRHPAVHQCSVVGCTDKDHVQGRLLRLRGAGPGSDKKKRQIVRELRQLCNEELPEYVQPVATSSSPKCPLPLLARWTTASWKKRSLLAITDPELHPVIFQTLSSPERESFFVWKKLQNTDAAMAAIF